jgi:sulfur-oxidizing protein SoxB
MVRVGGLQYSCTPNAQAGARIGAMTLNGKAIDANKNYKVASWAPVAEGAKGEPIWDVMETYFRAHPVIKPRKLNQPRLVGVAGNPGLGK